MIRVHFFTMKILNIETVRSEQTVQTQIRLLLSEQSDQGPHCFPFHLHLLDALLYCKTKLFLFYGKFKDCLPHLF